MATSPPRRATRELASHRRSSTYTWRDDVEAPRGGELCPGVAKLEPLQSKSSEVPYDLPTSPGQFETSSSAASTVSSPSRIHRPGEPQRPRVLPSLQVRTDNGPFCQREVARDGDHPESGAGCLPSCRTASPEKPHGCVSSNTAEPQTTFKSASAKAEFSPCGNNIDINSIEVADDPQPAGTIVQVGRAYGVCHCGKCRLCQAVVRTHRRDSVLSIDYSEASRRVSDCTTCSTNADNGGESRRRSYESGFSPCRSSNCSPMSGITVHAHSHSCSSVGEPDTTQTPVTVSDGEPENKPAKVSFDDRSCSPQCGSRGSSVAPDSPTSPTLPGHNRRRSRADSFLKVPERRNTLSRLEVPTSLPSSPRKRRFQRFRTEQWSRPSDVDAPTFDGETTRPDNTEAQPISPKRSTMRHPSAPCVPSFLEPPGQAQPLRRLSLMLPKEALANRASGPSPIQEHHPDTNVDAALDSEIGEDACRQRKKKPSLDLDVVLNKQSEISEKLSECPFKAMPVSSPYPDEQSPKESPKAGIESDFMHRLNVKLEKEALLRQRSDNENYSQNDSDEETSGERSVRSLAPDCESVPMPSPTFLSRDNTPLNRTPCRSPRLSQSFGGISPRGSGRGDASPWALLSRSASPRGVSPGVSPFHIPEESGDEQDPDVAKPQLSLERDFQPGDTIGAGSFGRVFSARHRVSGQIIAVKEMLLDQMGEAASQQKRLDRELRLCEQLRHERVVRYFGHEYSSRGSIGKSQSLFIFLEYCSGGSVASHLRTFGPLEEQLLSRYAQQLLQGLEYLHSLTPPVVHRDLKCANLLLTHDANVKLADFGCSKWLWDPDGLRDEEAKHSMVGSVFWAAPEALRGGVELTIAVDYWSFGCCILEMATAKHPWCEQQFDNIWQACRHIVFSDKLPEVSQDLAPCIQEVIYACLRREASDRASLEALRSLPLLAAVTNWAPP